MNLLTYLFKIKKIFGTYPLLFLLICLIFSTTKLFSQGFSLIREISPVNATAYTGDKPQSKIWNAAGYSWTVIPVPVSGGDPAGTYLFRLDNDTTWQKLFLLDPATDIKADVKSYGDTTHIILKQKNENNGSGGPPQIQQVKLISLELVNGSPPTYQLWSVRNSTVLVGLKNFAETATMDIDSQGRMWLACDGGGSSGSSNKDIYVKWSDRPYSNWSSYINMNGPSEQVDADDICSIKAFGSTKIGVFWSDQNLDEFRFRYHNDSDGPTTWSTLETAAGGDPGAADDHLNLAAASDGTIYVAAKTSYDSDGQPNLILLVRRPSGTWDPVYTVTSGSNAGTRPMVFLNENENILTICYTQHDGGGDILYQQSAVNPISFSSGIYYLTLGTQDYNNVSFSKQNIGDNIPIIYSTSSNVWSGANVAVTPIETYNGAGFAFHLNGLNDKAIVVAKTPSMRSIADNVTLEAWVKPNSVRNQLIIFNLDYPSGNNWHEGFALSLTSSGKIKFEMNYLDSVFSTSDYPIGKWTHIAATYDRTNMKIYINGILDAQEPYTDVIGDHHYDFIIGARSTYGPSTTYDRGFDGSIDEVRVWNVTRDENGIRDYMCKKVDLANLPSSLIAYWKFDTPTGFTVQDVTGNLNNGGLYNIGGFQYEWSGAPIGDDSQYEYSGLGGSFTAGIEYPSADYLVASALQASGATGIQVYRVDAPPLREAIAGGILPGATSPFDNISPYRYYGVKVIGSGTPTYDVTYHYLGHPGIGDESTLKLAFRDNLADNSWEDLGVMPDIGQHTLTGSGLTGTEFTLASTGNNPLPVELSNFTAKIVGSSVKLSWRTETEVRNYGFDLERSTDENEFDRVGFIEGNGNSNSPKFYSYSDPIQNFPEKVYYRLKQIDTDGSFNYSNIITVDISLPLTYNLFQNYPNPFNPSTKISFQIPKKSKVSLKVFNSLGELVAELLNEEIDPGFYELNFNAKSLASGVYVYTMSAGEYFASKKMLLLK